MVMFDPPAMSQGLDVPAKTLPVPGTPSPQIQKLINAPLRPGWNALPKSDQEWRQVVATGAAATLKTLPGLIDRMKVKVVHRHARLDPAQQSSSCAHPHARRLLCV
jgi:hypothetical protein